jgi:hypothetical protein
MKHLRALTLLALCLGGCGSAATAPRTPDPVQEGGSGGGGGNGGSGGAKLADAGGGRGGTPAADARAPEDAAADAGVVLADATAMSDLALAVDGPGSSPLAACPKPSVDHLEIWEAHGGSLKPAVGGNLLVKEGDRHYAKVDFLPGGEWHEIVVPLVNSMSKKTNLGASKGFTITYSATADLWVQLRPLSHQHGGEQHTAKLPSTGGLVKELFVPFTTDAWGMLLGTPPFPFSQALEDANFFNFVGPPGTANSFVVRGLRIDGFIPPCS